MLKSLFPDYFSVSNNQKQLWKTFTSYEIFKAFEKRKVDYTFIQVLKTVERKIGII
jgi:hypothetical protein